MTASTVLVVDDRPINREFLAALLGCVGYRVVHAEDGMDGLRKARAERPDLIISDILMPRMDGVEFARRLRADAGLKSIPIIFYTATYRVRDARRLAEECGITHVLGKPASPRAILQAIGEVLGAAARPLPPPPATARVSADTTPAGALQPQLQRNLNTLLGARPTVPGGPGDALSLRLAALTEIGLELSAERDLDRLLTMFVHAADDVMHSGCAAIVLFAQACQPPRIASQGLAPEVAAALPAQAGAAFVARLAAGERALRAAAGAAERCGRELPPDHPPLASLLALPVRTPARTLGWLYFGNRRDAKAYSDEDEQIAVALASQVALAVENLLLFAEGQETMRDLERQMAARAESEARFREIAETIREAFWLVDPDLRRVFYISPAYEEICGRSCASLYADPSSFTTAVHADDREPLRHALQRLREHGESDSEFRIVRPDGGQRWVRLRGFAIRDADGILRRIAGVSEDISLRKSQEERIRRLNRIHSLLSGINSAIVRIHDRQELFRETCRIAVALGEFSLAWIGRDEGGVLQPLTWHRRGTDDRAPAALDLADDSDAAAQLVAGRPVISNDLGATAAAGPKARALLPLREDGRLFGVLALYADHPEFFDADELRLLDELAGDISFALAYIARDERLDYLAYFDALTGLPNRSLLQDRLTQLLQAAQHEGHGAALIIADIERFDELSLSLGRRGGDELLQHVAVRLVQAQTGAATLARIGVDVFALAVGGLARDGDALHALKQGVLAPLARPLVLRTMTVTLKVQAGIALYPGDGDSAEVLLAAAESALSQAKATGEPHRHFDADQNARNVRKLELENQLRQALADEQFAVYLQPKVSLQSGEIVGAEGLVRWRHPQRGIVEPAEFIALAEETGLIGPIGEWVLHEVCRLLASWQRMGLPTVPLAVNLSALQLQSGNVPEMIAAALAATEVEASLLELELTESMVMRDADAAIATLQRVRGLGVKLALDDFGTGYSSLAYLKRFPFSSVKIDRSFVTDILHNPEDAAIADAVIAIARRLGMRTVAEGVESEGQMNYLRMQRCDEMQGYLFSPPVPPDEFAAMLAAGRRLPLPA